MTFKIIISCTRCGEILSKGEAHVCEDIWKKQYRENRIEELLREGYTKELIRFLEGV